MDSNQRSSAEAGRCMHFVLARGTAAQVEYCAACGVFHVNVDSVTLRFRATALRDLKDTLAAALTAYQRALEQLPDDGQEPLPHDGLH